MHALDQLFLDIQHALAGEYSLERELGRGGMGIVYLARDVQLDRLVAIKVLPRETANRDDTRERFLREARTAAQLFHPNIVPIYRVGEAAGLPYFVMAYVDGETLGERLRRRGPVMASAMTDILRDVAQALGYAHGRGVIHRDVKPDNILLDRESGRALVSDFGIASRLDDRDSQTALVGTTLFMSPEQMQGLTLDGRTDLYALGLVAFAALSGKFPFDAGTSAATMMQRVSVTPRTLAAIAPELPPALIRAVDTCLLPDINQRFTNAEALVNALDPDRPVRTKLPAALREWVRPTWLVGVLPVWAVGGVGIALFSPGVSSLTLATLAAAPLALIGVTRLRHTYAALAAGHSLADLRFALRSRNLAHDSEPSQRESASYRILRSSTLAAVTAAALATIVLHYCGYNTRTGAPNTTFTLPSSWLTGIGILGRGALALGAVGTVLLGNLGVGVLPPRLERRTLGRLREHLWKSRAGAWLVAKLTPKHRALASTEFRPTEMALAVAADDLFAALPTAYRESLGELPSVVARLTARASALRESVDHLTKLLSIGGAASHHELADRVSNSRTELSETVTAIERIRMDLLRLHGGLADLRPITSSLNAARLMAADIERLRWAQREVASDSWLPIDVRTPTPA